MSSFGVVPEGFERKDFETIKSEIEAEQIATFGNVQQSPTSALGQLNGIFARKLAEAWEVLEAVYRSFDPDAAEGEALDGVGALTGASRLAASKSTVTLTVSLDAGTVLPVGRVVSVTNVPSKRFVTLAEVENATAFADDFEVAAECEDTGPVEAAAGSLEVIETPVTGWTAVTNALDADEGRDIESDAAYRTRRAELLTASGSGTVDAIRSAVLAVEDVTECSVFENTSLAEDADGVPAKAFEVVARGGDDDEIAQAIWDNKCAGILSHGDEIGSAVDALGDLQAIDFSRPTEVPLYITVTVTTDSDYPVDGDDQIKDALVDYGDAFVMGQDAIETQFYAAVFSIAGVVDITALQIDDNGSFTTPGNQTATARQLFLFDTSRFTVVS